MEKNPIHDLPPEGDPGEFKEEPVGDPDLLPFPPEGSEDREEPNDLSGIDKEFDD